MKFAFLSAVVSLCVLSSACTSNGGKQKQASATLAFASPGSASGVSGAFSTLDGKVLVGQTVELTVSAGQRTIGYMCPDTVTTDGPLTVKATFEAGKNYVLECRADEPATINER